MSATVDERIESLNSFSPRVVASYLDETGGVEYQLTFYPHLNAFKVHRSDEPQLNPGLPALTVSYTGFIGGEITLNLSNKMDHALIMLKAEWDKISEEERAEFYDNIPLNSLYMGGNPQTH